LPQKPDHPIAKITTTLPHLDVLPARYDLGGLGRVARHKRPTRIA
jgi:hypothetical protein